MSDAGTHVKMYRTRSCPFCIMAAELLRSHGIAFEEVYLDQEPNRRAITAAIKPGHTTVPLVVAGDTPVGGFDDLRRLDAAGVLEETLGVERAG